MSRDRVFFFTTEAEAKAFVQGIEYVNDSALEVKDISRVSALEWRVVLEDEDYDE